MWYPVVDFFISETCWCDVVCFVFALCWIGLVCCVMRLVYCCFFVGIEFGNSEVPKLDSSEVCVCNSKIISKCKVPELVLFIPKHVYVVPRCWIFYFWNMLVWCWGNNVCLCFVSISMVPKLCCYVELIPEVCCVTLMIYCWCRVGKSGIPKLDSSEVFVFKNY